MRVARVLLTGFEPFAGDSINPSMLVVEQLRKTWTNHTVRLYTAVLPVMFGEIRQALMQLYDRHDPDVVIHIGQADGRSCIGVERFAVNLMDAPIQDNAGVQPIDEPCESGGPLAVMSTLPVKRIVAELRKNGIPSKLSNSAGTFLCNAVLYHSLRIAEKMSSRVRSGLVHLPLLPEQATKRGQPWGEYPYSMSLEIMTRAIHITIDQAVRYDFDEHLSLGSVS